VGQDRFDAPAARRFGLVFIERAADRAVVGRGKLGHDREPSVARNQTILADDRVRSAWEWNTTSQRYQEVRDWDWPTD
jgi:hypothetical protein